MIHNYNHTETPLALLARRAAFLVLLLLLTLNACTGAQPAPTQQASPTNPAASALPATATPAAYPAVTDTAAPYPAGTAYPSPAYPAPSSSPVTAVNLAPLPPLAVPFNGQRAYQDVQYQMSLGPRIPDSPAHAQVIEWMRKGLSDSGWTVETQDTTLMNHPIHNVIAKRGSGSPWIIIGAHYDSRMKADHDPDPAQQDKPVPGANDGASGVAVLMEMARMLPKDLKGQVWLAFFDAEDQGDLPGWDWILGSRALTDSLNGTPDAVVVIDMIGDANLNIYQETNSNPLLTQEIWETAARLGYDKEFIAQPKYNMLDDHTPFLQKGIHAVDLIDFDYPYWHTTQDTADKVSAQSLNVVGDTLLHWLLP